MVEGLPQVKMKDPRLTGKVKSDPVIGDSLVEIAFMGINVPDIKIAVAIFRLNLDCIKEGYESYLVAASQIMLLTLGKGVSRGPRKTRHKGIRGQDQDKYNLPHEKIPPSSILYTIGRGEARSES
jgi:hypothetical protein